MFARPACGLRSPLAATASGQVLSPGFSTRLPGLQITRRHQGFIRIRPSGLPLARSLPRTVRGPLGFFPELRTPTGRTRRRTSGRGSVTNTNRELRDRHRRPPIHELTHMRDIASHPQVLIIAPDARLHPSGTRPKGVALHSRMPFNRVRRSSTSVLATSHAESASPAAVSGTVSVILHCHAADRLPIHKHRRLPDRWLERDARGDICVDIDEPIHTAEPSRRLVAAH